MSTAIKELPRQIDAALRQPWQIRALAIVDAIIVNVIILLAARVVTGDFPQAMMSGSEETIGVPEVVLTTAAVGLVAALLLGLLERYTSRGKSIWTVVAILALLVSLVGPLDRGVDTTSKLVLALLHVGAAATIIPLMRRELASS